MDETPLVRMELVDLLAETLLDVGERPVDEVLPDAQQLASRGRARAGDERIDDFELRAERRANVLQRLDLRAARGGIPDLLQLPEQLLGLLDVRPVGLDGAPKAIALVPFSLFAILGQLLHAIGVLDVPEQRDVEGAALLLRDALLKPRSRLAQLDAGLVLKGETYRLLQSDAFRGERDHRGLIGSQTRARFRGRGRCLGRLLGGADGRGEGRRDEKG